MTSLRALFVGAALAGVIASGSCTVPGTDQGAGGPTVQTIDLGAKHSVWRSAGAVTGEFAAVWGGLTRKAGSSPTASGWIISTKAGVSAIPTSEPPIAARSGHLAVGHSGRVLFWGGVDAVGQHLNDGAILDPESNSWQRIPNAPFGIESATAVVDGDYVLIGAGRREGNQFNTSILEYHVPSGSWRVIDHGVTGVITWALAGETIVTVSRQPNAADLTVAWFGRDSRSIHRTSSIDVTLATAAYLGVTANRDDVVIAASTREQTEVFRLSSEGALLQKSDLDGTVFTPALSAASGTSANVTPRLGDTWFSLMEWDIQSMSISGMTGNRAWRLPTCRTESAWIALGNQRFLRYGGIGCEGDVPADDGAPMQLVDLS